MGTQRTITRLIASSLCRLKRAELGSGRVRFLVFTGTAGKTTTREAVAFALTRVGAEVRSLPLGYTNELGVVLTALGIGSFSPTNPADWLRVLSARIPKECYALVELGADFYQDIPWFLRRCVPTAVFVSGTASASWSRDIEEVAKDRRELLRAVPASGDIFYDADDEDTTRLVEESAARASKHGISLRDPSRPVFVEQWSRNIYQASGANPLDTPEYVILRVDGESMGFSFPRPLLEPQVFALAAAAAAVRTVARSPRQLPRSFFDGYAFSPERLSITKARNGALLFSDIYKATPKDTEWFLAMALRLKARRRVLVLTELRPLTLHAATIYENLGARARGFDAVYFLGPEAAASVLHRMLPEIRVITREEYPRIADEILRESNEEDRVFLKGSFRYDLASLRAMLG